MGQFEKLLEYVKGLNKNTSEQGTWFENFMKYVFLTSPVYQELYEKSMDMDGISIQWRKTRFWH